MFERVYFIMKINDKALYISNETITELWARGITDTHKAYDADGLALNF